MRYLLINSLKFGGAEKVAQILANAGVFDKIIILEDEQDFMLNIPIIKLSKHDNIVSSIFKTFFIPIYAWRLNKIINKDDIVVSFIERANFVNLVSKIFLNHKAIITLHTNISSSFKTFKKYFYYLLIKILYPRADAVISVSKGINEDFQKTLKFKGYSTVIYNPIDLVSINNLKNEALDFSGEFLENSIITVGRLFYQKAQWVLLCVFRDLLKYRPGVKLFIIGDGDLRQKLLDYASGLGLRVFSVFSQPLSEISNSYDVYFLGFQKNPYKFMTRATIFSLSSVSEGLPMVVLEAMACGSPIISSDCNYGPREILVNNDKKFGLLVPVLDFKLADNRNESDVKYKEWIETFSSLLKDEKKKEDLKQLSLTRANDFSIEEIKKTWFAVFKIY